MNLDKPKLLVIAARVVGYRCFEALFNRGHHIVGLLTLDESKAGQTTAFASFDNLINESLVPAQKFRDLKTKALINWAGLLNPDLGIVVGVSQLIPRELLILPKFGFIGMHPTLLPEGRGRAPIPWALIKGLNRTGTTWFQCEAGADTGKVIAQKEIPIYYEDTSSSLGTRTDDAAIELLMEVLKDPADRIRNGLLQDESNATVWPQRRPQDGIVDWTNDSQSIYNFVRALTKPYPGAFTFFGKRKLYIWKCRETRDHRSAEPGRIIAQTPNGLLVGCKEGCVLLTEMEWDGGEELELGEFKVMEGKTFNAVC